MSLDLSYRINFLREKLSKENLDAFLVSSQENRFYLTGWWGDSESGFLLLTKKSSFIITDGRYSEEVAGNVSSFELREYGQDEEFWNKIFLESKVKRLGFEASDLSVSQLKKLKKKSKRVKFYPKENFIEELRAIKSKQELSLIKKAVTIAEGSFGYLLKNLKIGMKENEVAWEIEKFMRERGASKNAWDLFIVASGPNSSMAHYTASNRKLKKGDQVLLDWGCTYQGYSCDLSRVVFLGTPTLKQVEIYNLVIQAQKKALEKVKTNAFTKEADQAARDFLKEKTPYYFMHALGHGVGIQVHELPRINPKAKDRFQEGNVFTIEPGIYIPGWGGVRIEDMYVLDKKRGAILLSKSTKQLSDIIIN